MTGITKGSLPPCVVILMGVSGCGKSTTGKRLAKKLGWTFRDGDEFHPATNVAKMKAGTPLTDEDRWPWLDAIAAWIETCRADGTHGIVACSALKRVYRERLTRGAGDVRVVYLRGSQALIGGRMARRKNHFMPASLLYSQFATLEEPVAGERVIIVDVALPPERVVSTIVERIGGAAVDAVKFVE